MILFVRLLVAGDIFVNCNWVDTLWQLYSTHLHTNNAQNKTINLGRMRAVPRLCKLYSGICLKTEEKALYHTLYHTLCTRPHSSVKTCPFCANSNTFHLFFLNTWDLNAESRTVQADVINI